jgi:hypothetical protein
VVIVGVNEIFAPLALVPTETPPTGTVNQLIEVPTAVAFKVVEAPAQIVLGAAVTKVGVGHWAVALLIPIANKIAESIL